MQKPLEDSRRKSREIFNNYLAKSMTKHTVEVGDKFKLEGYTWEVIGVESGCFRAKSDVNWAYFSFAEYLNKLNWLAPEIKKLTKEQAEMIKHNGSVPPPIGVSYFAVTEAWLDSITE